MRLTFAVEPDTRVRQLAEQAASAVAELGLVGLLGGVASLAGGYSLLTACGTVALLYYPLATVLTGRVISPSHLRSILKVHPAGVSEPVSVPEPAPLYLVPRQAATPALMVGVTADEFPQPRSVAR
jgi:hypothetical protein